MKRKTDPTDIGLNRTGIGTAPALSKKMIEAQKQHSPEPDGAVITAERTALSKQAPPVGTMPPPASIKGVAKAAVEALKGDDPMVFLDKLGERLAFERGGVRLYQALLVKHAAATVHEGGPTREQLQQFLDEELAHFHVVREAMENLGGDPTAVTPCADITSTAASGLVQVLTDPRTTLTQALEAILIAELADNDGWRTLVSLAEGFGKKELARRFEEALVEEENHLAHVRAWLAQALMGQAGVELEPAPPPSL
jgi:rubrerythrin